MIDNYKSQRSMAPMGLVSASTKEIHVANRVETRSFWFWWEVVVSHEKSALFQQGTQRLNKSIVGRTETRFGGLELSRGNW